MEDAQFYNNRLRMVEISRILPLITETNHQAEWFTLPGYGHEWRFWDLAIQHALTFFGLDADEGGNPF